MTKELFYRGYSGSAEFSHEDGCLHGRILSIDDLITYEAADQVRLQAEFERAVDQYLAHCKSRERPVSKPA